MLTQRPTPPESTDATPNVPTIFMTLPREIRAEIYSNLLASTYRVDTSPCFRASKAFERSGSYQGRLPGHHEITRPLLSFELPSERLAILQVNKAIGEEAKVIYYKSSTFIFNIPAANRASSINLGHLSALKYMTRIHVNLKLRMPFYRQSFELKSVQKLLPKFIGHEPLRDRCVISINYSLSPDFVWEILPTMVRNLTSFKTLELELEYMYTGCQAEFGVDMMRLVESENLPMYTRLEKDLSPNLGDGKARQYEDGVYCLKYYSWNFIEKCRS